MSERKRLCATEREALMNMSLAMDIMLRAKDLLPERMKMIEYGARDLGAITNGLTRLRRKILRTVPDCQIETLQRNLKACSYTIGVRRPGKEQAHNYKDFGCWVSWDFINEMLLGLHDHCLMCGLNAAEQRACPLAKALDSIPSDIPDAPGDGCRYRGIL